MRTDYFGHDRQYQQRRSAGQPGWNTSEDTQENLDVLRREMAKPYIPRKGRLLEVGSGAGDLSIWLAAQGYAVHGVDISPTAVEWAREKAVKAGVSPHFTTGDVRTLAEFADEHFDIVLDGYCLHCIIGADRPLFLASVHRVLKPGGVFQIHTMCGTPTSEAIRQRFDPVSGYVLYGEVATRYIGKPEDILQEIEAAGFAIVSHYIDPAVTPEAQDVLHIDACKNSSRTVGE